MLNHNALTAIRPETGASSGHHRVYGAGLLPNIMNRFMLSNSHEVLFVT